MTAGYVLGERHRRDTPTGTGPTQPAGSTSIASSAPSIPVDGPACPDPAQQAAAVYGARDLRQIFMIKTANSSTVWICEDANTGQLFYQSHTLLNGQDVPLQQNKNGLFLPGVTHKGSGYEVYDQKRNRFEITRERLQIFFVNGNVQSSDVDKLED
jgi:hypothetical protein